MKILPNGQVEITNGDTGEKRVVSANELTNYGIDPADYQKARDVGVNNGAVRTYGATTNNTSTYQNSPISPAADTRKPLTDFVVKDNPVEQTKSTNSTSNPSLVTRIGTGTMNFVKGLMSPADRFGTGLGQTISEAFNQSNKKSTVDQSIKNNQKAFDLARKLQKEGKLEQAKKLLQETMKSANRIQGDAGKNVTDTQARSEVANENTIKGGVGTASFFMPGGNTATKRILTSGVAGSGFGFSGSEKGNELVDTIGGGVTGLALGAGFEGLGKIKNAITNKFRGGSNALQNEASNIEQGTRQIKQKASVYGASGEKSINNTLDKYNFSGSAQKQYENLEPTMAKIEQKIQKLVVENPNIVIPKEEIKKSFMENLKSSIRSKDLTNKQAGAEAQGYLDDLIKASGGKGKFTNIDLGTLRELKKLVNEDYGPVHEIMVRGGALTPRQKVIAASWDSLDNAVQNASPELKKLLSDESNLYKAAQSLSSARSNPPTLRIAGTSVPQRVTQGGRDVATKSLKMGGKVLDGVGNVIPGNPQPAIRNLAISNVLGLGKQNGQNVQNNNQNNTTNNESNGQFDASQYHTDNTTAQPTQNQVTYATGNSPEFWNTQYQQAMRQNPIDQVTAKYALEQRDYEEKYQKNNAPAKNKALSVAGSKEVSRNQTALNDIKELETILKNDPSKLILSALPGSLGARKYRALWGGIIDAVGTNRTGATYTPEQRKDYAYLLPAIGDSPGEIAYKMNRIKGEVQNFLNNVSTSVPDYYNQESGGLGATPPAL